MLLAAVAAPAAELRDLRLLEGPDSTRVVFDLDVETAPKVFTLANPDRVVIDFADAQRATGLRLDAGGKGLIKAVRTGPREKGLRVVLDVGSAVSPKSFGLQPSGSYGYRLILDLYPQNAAMPSETQAPGQITATVEPPLVSAPALPPRAAAPAAEKPATTAQLVAPVAQTPVQLPAAPAPQPSSPVAAASTPASASSPFSDHIQIAEKPIVIAVDAGHGGQDPGARGRGGLQEKDVTLAIARRLAKKIDAQPGMRAVLTRDGDYFVELRERTVRARRAQADLFVSIHANAYKDRDMRGTAVYVLSDRGASSEQSRWIASHENAADLVGGVKLKNKDDDLAAVLIDISQSATMEASFDLGSRLIDSLGKVNTLQKAVVQQAGFLVLKSPDIPSVLVETAFISNPEEEHLLRDPDYQDKLASSVFEGVHSYFSRYRPLQQVAVSPREAPVHHAQGKVVPVSLKGAGTD
ncbi:MAG: N-acetylmuramoyl-L-alanine amidase [Nevskia sp.]